MKKKNLTLIFCLTAFSMSAQDYLISFSGTGESNTVSTVIVENMTQNKNLTLNGNDILHLTSAITGIPELVYHNTESVQIYPNPMNELSVMEFTLPEEGVAKIELFDMTGRKLTETQKNLNSGRHSFRISGVGIGVYILKVTSGKQIYSARLISKGKTGEKANITYQSTILLNDKSELLKSAKSEILMQYTTGDLLKFTATGGEHKSVLVYEISASRNVNFQFYKCTDLDNKNYATVKIGQQIWMAENYAYLPAVSPPTEFSYTSPYYFVYGYYGTDVAEAKATINYATYGVLYNWSSAKAAFPTGWHLPSYADWTALENYLLANGYTYSDEYYQNNNGKSLAATTNWINMGGGVSTTDYPALRNKTGFSGLPGGYSYSEVRQTYFDAIEYQTGWWSSDLQGTKNKFAWYVVLSANLNSLYYTNGSRFVGMSVRYIKD